MKNKNKNKNTEFIYLRKFEDSDFQHVQGERLNSKEKKEGKTVDVIDKNELTKATNSTLSSYQSNLNELDSSLI